MDTGSVINAAITSLGHAQTVNYANAICVALVAYDFLLTLADEVRLIWPARWNIGKVLFFLTRYPVFLDVSLNLVDLIHPNLKLDLCKPIYQAAAWMSFTGITIAEIIMMMRVYAICGTKREVLVFLIIFNLGIIIPDIILLQKSLRSLVFMPSPFPTLAPCVLINADVTVYVDFVLIMVSEFVVVVMTFWKCFADWKANKSPLMKALFEDGLQYFVCMFAISLANLLVVKTVNVDFSGLLFEIQRVMHSMLSGRMLMHLRDAVTPAIFIDIPTQLFTPAPGTTPDVNSISQMEFGEAESAVSKGSATAQLRSVEIRPSSFKTQKAGPLNGVHITRGTISDEELYQAIRVGNGTNQ